MIKLYEATETEFLNNGIKILKPLKATITCEDNGNYNLELEDKIENIDYYVQDNIILVPSPDGEQPFRINNIQKKNTKISCIANHVYYDSANYVIEDSYVNEKDCNYALDYFNSACDRDTPFTTSSDITTIASFRCVRKSFEEAIGTIIERWGGHLVRDKFNISINANIGQDKGVTIAYGKNITNIEAIEDWSSVVTKLMPTTTYNRLVYMLPEKYIESDVKYNKEYAKIIQFENELNDEDYKDAEGNVDLVRYENDLINWLRTKAIEYVEINKVPKVNYTLNAHMDNITGLGDLIRVKHPKSRIDLTTNVIAYRYDCILGKYKEITFGNFTKKLSSLITDFNRKIEETKETITKDTTSIITKELEDASDKIRQNFNGYNIYEADCFYAMDNPIKEDAKNILIINKNGIGFSTSGINGTFNGVLGIDGTLDFKNINVINLLASMIKCDNLKVGGLDNQSGNIELLDEAGKKIAQQDKDGIQMFTKDGGTLKINHNEGLCFYNSSNSKEWWADGSIFHTKKFEAEDEFTLGTIRQLPIEIKNEDGTIKNIGVVFVSLV